MIPISHDTQKHRLRTRFVLSCVMMFPLPVLAGDWPAFRGPGGNGVASGGHPPTHWSPDQNVKWRIPVPGSGNGSPVVVAGRVLLNAAQQHGQRRTLYCLDVVTGGELWHQTTDVDQVELTHIRNPYCGSTPASDGNVVVTWHGTGGLHCYGLRGDPLWSRSFGEIRHLWGYASSPVIHEDTVYLFSGAGPDMFMAAIRLADGELIWKTDEPGGQSNETPDGELTGSWCTPVITEFDGQQQLICAYPTAAVAFNLQTGDILWRCAGLSGEHGNLVYASPLITGDRAIFMAGYQGPMMAVTLKGRGDVTDSHRIWIVTEHNPQRIGTGVVVGDHIYIGNADGGTIQCVAVATGESRWRQRVQGGPHWASTVFAGGYLYATNTTGTTRVFNPSPEGFELIAENSLNESTYATPAFADDSIIIRTEGHLYAIGRDDPIQTTEVP